MARKSRRSQNNSTPEINISSVQLATAAYCRLSVEDENEDSIQTQVALVQDFIGKHLDLKLADTYIDNGVSGTRFDRPEWNRLMEDARSGKIQCIVVKDLSRFGRNYVEAGYYIESIFPRLNIRFIAITDDFDSSRKSDMEDLKVPVKNMVNAMYARDISRKVATSARLRQQRGELMKTSTPPFGYRYGENKDTLVVDEEAAPVVRMMFKWTLLGVRPAEIKRRLELMNIPAPRAYYRQKEMGKDADGNWGSTAIRNILSNQTFCGDTVTGKTRTRMREKSRVDEDSWIVTENTHEPIISREVFAAVQEILEGRTVEKKRRMELSKERWQDVPNELAGIAYCAVCGRALSYERRYGTGKFAKIPMGKYYCHEHYGSSQAAGIPANLLKMIIMDQVQMQVSLLCEKRDLLKKSESGALAEINRQVSSLAFQKQQASERKAGLYENFVSGVVDQEDYMELKEHYTAQVQELEEKYEDAVNRQRQVKKSIERFVGFVDGLDEPSGIGFDEKLVRAMVERVELGTDNSISIRFRYADEFAELLGEEERQ